MKSDHFPAIIMTFLTIILILGFITLYLFNRLKSTTIELQSLTSENQSYKNFVNTLSSCHFPSGLNVFVINGSCDDINNTIRQNYYQPPTTFCYDTGFGVTMCK